MLVPDDTTALDMDMGVSRKVTTVPTMQPCERGCTQTQYGSPPGLCLVILGGGMGQIGPPGFWLTHPPTHIRKFFLRKKMKSPRRGC